VSLGRYTHPTSPSLFFYAFQSEITRRQCLTALRLWCSRKVAAVQSLCFLSSHLRWEVRKRTSWQRGGAACECGGALVCSISKTRALYLFLSLVGSWARAKSLSLMHADFPRRRLWLVWCLHELVNNGLCAILSDRATLWYTCLRFVGPCRCWWALEGQVKVSNSGIPKHLYKTMLTFLIMCT
jgi:hypothetical protein